MSAIFFVLWVFLWVLLSAGVLLYEWTAPTGGADLLAVIVITLSAAAATGFVPIALAFLVAGVLAGRDVLHSKLGLRLSVLWFLLIAAGIPVICVGLCAGLLSGSSTPGQTLGTLAQVLATLIVAVLIDLRSSLEFAGWGRAAEVRVAIQLGLLVLLGSGVLMSVAGLMVADRPDTEVVRYGLARAMSFGWALAAILAATLLLVVGALSRVLRGDVPVPRSSPPWG